MATRKVIDAKQNGKKVWLKGHAQATYMSNGSTVEEAINSIQVGNGGIATETDPIFLASPAASITEAKKTEWDNKMDKVILSTVATSGNYNDLTNKPTIPASVTESTVSGWGFTKNTGTVTGVKINDTTKSPTSGIVDLGTVITAHQTLKTINGESIVGSGNIEISGGSSSDANVQAVDTGDVIDDVTVDYATKTYVDNKVANIDLTSYATTSYVDGLVGDINSTIGDINSVLESIINS